MEFGISMFGDLGKGQTQHQRVQELIREIQLADELGIDVFGIGEHHRSDYVVSSPQIILAAAATVTKRIKLSSSVTVLSSSDPVKIYQDFATVDLLSGGRAEITAGRGSFVESFPVFGFDLKDYNALFEEKLELLLKINSESPVTWKGKFRAPLNEQHIFPRAKQNKLPVWIAVGGTPESVQRAARLNLPLVIAILGGDPRQFAPYFQYYREELVRQGHHADLAQAGLHAHVFVGEKSDQTCDMYFPYYAGQMKKLGKERGWAPYSREQYEMGRSANGALFVGSPEEVAEKIVRLQKLFGLTRFVAHMDVGAPPHEKLMGSIQLFGEKVMPLVKQALKA